MPDRTLSRREFLKRSAVGAVSAGAMLEAALAHAQQAATEERNKKDTMRYRLLKRPNLLISELSLGGQFLTAPVFTAALDKGVNFLHVSVEYPGCFDEAAKVLKDQRKDVFLAVKGRPGGLVSPRELDGWLKALGTDHADFLFVPAHIPDIPRDQDGQIRQQFEAIKKAGKARFLGLTCHAEPVEVSKAGIEAGYYDVLMPRYGVPMRADMKPILDLAQEKGVGVMGMKSMQAGGGRRNWATSFQQALEHPGMTAILKSLPDFDMLNEFADAVMKRPTKEARLQFERDVARVRSSTCRMCSTCAGCPQDVAIEDTLRCAFYYGGELGQLAYGRHVYAALPQNRTVLACADCGRCEAVCPNRLPVRRMLREAHAMLA